MKIQEFANYFLPYLIKDYLDGVIPFHGLVDIDTWKRIFPETFDSDQFHWYEISFTCNRLQDGSILLSFLFPQPTEVGHPKYAAIRLNPEVSQFKSVCYFQLRKPFRIYDAWEIFGTSYNNHSEGPTLSYVRKIEGTDSLRNFIITVQQISNNLNAYLQV